MEYSVFSFEEKKYFLTLKFEKWILNKWKKQIWDMDPVGPLKKGRSNAADASLKIMLFLMAQHF